MRLADLFSHDALDAAIRDGFIRRQYHPSAPLAILNYTELAQFKREWNDVTRACRGKLPHPTADANTGSEWQPWEPTTGLDPVYLVDIDGTVAIKGDRDIYDGSKAYLDTPNWNVVRIIRMLQKTHRIVYMTGRDAEHRRVTAEWLKTNGLIAHELHTRPLGDKRKDSTVKHELFNQHIRGKYNVTGVFDDRNQVVEMWRAIGLTVFQVADGNF